MLQKLLKYTSRKIRNIARSGKKHSLALFGRNERTAQDGSLREQVDKSAAIQQEPPVEAAGASSEGEKRKRKRSRPRRKRWDISSFEVPEEEGKVRFHDLGLPNNIMHAIADLDFKYCTPIQEKALPDLLKGRDLIGKANTGTGKSAVFLLSILLKLLKEKRGKRENGKPLALILAPTRELVMQIVKDGKKLGKYTHLNIVAVYGGVDYAKQMQHLKGKKCDVVAATPGRLLDFLGKGVIDLKECETLVIDEADRMLDMGFIPDVRRIIYKVKERKERQTMLFSATLTEDVQRLAAQWCREPVLIEIEPEQVAVDTVEQKVYLVTSEEKYTVLYNVIKKLPGDRVMVFVNQKNDARRLQERLRRNEIHCTLLTGDVPQKKRVQRLESFRSGKINVLVATDVAGRGIHIEGISHVVNYTLPYEPEDYVHRIGRTGRAGAAGISLSFACEEGGFYLPAIEEFIGKKMDCIVPEEDLLVPPPKGTAPKHVKKKPSGRRPAKKRHSRSNSGQVSS